MRDKLEHGERACWKRNGRCVPLKDLIGKHSQRPHVYREGCQHGVLPFSRGSNSLQATLLLPFSTGVPRVVLVFATFACCTTQHPKVAARPASRASGMHGMGQHAQKLFHEENTWHELSAKGFQRR